ncbi:MAG: DUF2716 domain-containing protein [Oscillospiraceae bacterium]|nr:DUF2716 domain-containing protein [Oscillospiraceae bacterium]
MQIILDEKEYLEIWDSVYAEYWFEREAAEWLRLPLPHKKYRLRELWTEEQERIVNSIFSRLCPQTMYALDWQHDCFLFSPTENIPPDFWFHDAERDCNVYFPCYYPNGDFHFFLSSDRQLGLFGHPWREEIYVMGNELIAEFDHMQDQLGLAECP